MPLAKQIGQCPNGFYSPELNAHFIHCAGDSTDNGAFSVYRYKRAMHRNQLKPPNCGVTLRIAFNRQVFHFLIRPEKAMTECGK